MGMKKKNKNLCLIPAFQGGSSLKNKKNKINLKLTQSQTAKTKPAHHASIWADQIQECYWKCTGSHPVCFTHTSQL